MTDHSFLKRAHFLAQNSLILICFGLIFRKYFVLRLRAYPTAAKAMISADYPHKAHAGYMIGGCFMNSRP
jgi:hypothetical protein